MYEGVVAEAERAMALCHSSTKSLQSLAKQRAAIAPHFDAVGGPTLCAPIASVGDPRQYSSSTAFLKALGLNLKGHSSGKHQGRLAITKRGPSIARKILYYCSLRAVQRPELKQWYNSFRRIGSVHSPATSEHRSMKGLEAMMRKLWKSLWYVYQHNESSQYSNVFPGRPLDKPENRKRHNPKGHSERITP
ncbi:MAG: transposase [Planctomycetota bacterium]